MSIEKKIIAKKKVKTKNGKAITTNTEPKIFKNEPAIVSFGLGATVNLGNYESKKIFINISVPCVNTSVNIKKAITKIKKEVAVELDEEINTIRAGGDLIQKNNDIEGLDFVSED